MPRVTSELHRFVSLLAIAVAVFFSLGISGPAFAQDSEVLRPRAIVDAIAQLDAIANRTNQRSVELQRLSRQAVDLRRALPEDFSAVAGSGAVSTAEERDMREDELTLLLAQFREYRRTLIEVYDIIGSDHDPESSIYGMLLAWVRQAAEIQSTVRALPEDQAANLDPEITRGLNMVRDFAAIMVSNFSSAGVHISPDVPLLPLSTDKELPSASAPLGAPETRVPALLVQPLEVIQANPSVVVSIHVGSLREIQTAIDPVERAQFAIEHEYQTHEAARLQALDDGSSTVDSGTIETAAASDLARLRRQIERRTSYRESLMRSIQTAILRHARQKRATGEPEFLAEVTNLISPKAQPQLTDESRAEVLRIARSVAADLGEFTARPAAETDAKLVREVSQWDEDARAARKEMLERPETFEDGAANLMHWRLRLQYETMSSIRSAKSLRLANLRESISRDAALLQVTGSRLAVAISSLGGIDHRIAQLEAQRKDTAVSFYLWAAAKVAVILALAWLLIALVRGLTNRLVNRVTCRVQSEEGDVPPERKREVTARANTLQSVSITTVKIVVGVTTILMILGQFEVNYHPLLLATGGITLAIGFGAQSLVKDFFAGFFILLENQFQVGDVVTLNGTTGGVESVSLRTTRLRSVDGTLHIVPNGVITMVSNLTHLWSRMSINIGVGYGEDPDEVREVLNRIGDELYADPEWSPKMLEAPRVTGLDNFGGSSIDFRVMCKVRPGEQWGVTREFRRRVKIGFDLVDIEIPYAYVNYVPVTPGPTKVLTNRDRDRDISMPREERVPDGGK
jgi:small-conductance mechanosensitive channel